MTTSHNDEREVRIARLKELRNIGVDPFPSKAQRTHTCNEARTRFNELSESVARVVLVGRIRNQRRHGGSAFFTIEDGTDRLQVYVKRDEIGDNYFHVVKNLTDIGDFLEVEGTLFTTKTGEKTLHADRIAIISKSLLPLPEQWHGLNDIEIRYRQRYLDLIANPGVRDIFVKRSKIIAAVREYFDKEGFLEVETPILQAIAGGAAARPFVTHHQALDADMYLRVAPELYLKRLIVGGFERVYEFARCFRNEGIDHAHNPEFTQVEAYMAYADYQQLMVFVEMMLSTLVRSVFDASDIQYKGTNLSFAPSFIRRTFRDCLLEYANIDIDISRSDAEFQREAANRGVDCAHNPSRASQLDELFKLFVRPQLIQPVFIIEYPLELSPLAKKISDKPQYTERFQLVCAGMEIVNGFSELNDPVDQKERFDQQFKQRTIGYAEAHEGDDDFVTALEYGMPPTAGFGMGIDRLTVLLTGSHSLKEVIFFPTLRLKRNETEHTQ